MLPIPDEILAPFNALMDERSVTRQLRADYRKWLMYYLDFRAKYPPPDARSEQVRLFIEKLRSKGQSQNKLEQAAEALSLFFAVQPRKKQAAASVAETAALLSSPGVLPERKSIPRTVSPVKGEKVGRQGSGQRSGKRYNEWRCLEKTASPEWDGVISKLADEIRTRHYSRKTLKHYADWSRKFQSYLKNKPPEALSSSDVKAYLTHLAVHCKVSSSHQNLAFNALLFLFRHVLRTDFGIHRDIPRAKRSSYIPVVLTRNEVDAVLRHLKQPHDLIVKLLYGCGLRLFECLKLRVQNFNFNEGVLTVQYENL